MVGGLSNGLGDSAILGGGRTFSSGRTLSDAAHTRDDAS